MAGYPEKKREKISDPFSAEMCNVICSGNFFFLDDIFLHDIAPAQLLLPHKRSLQ